MKVICVHSPGKQKKGDSPIVFGEFTQADAGGWIFTAENGPCSRWIPGKAGEGHLRYGFRCDHCRFNLVVRADRLAPILNKLAAHGVDPVDLRLLSGAYGRVKT